MKTKVAQATITLSLNLLHALFFDAYFYTRSVRSYLAKTNVQSVYKNVYSYDYNADSC